MGIRIPDLTPPGAVTVYTRPGCVACTMTMRTLNRLGVPYTLIDISNHPDLIEHFTARGLRSLPVVATDNDVFAGFQPDRLRQLRPHPTHPVADTEHIPATKPGT